ncbi:MAG: helix-turn-helix domain-containing protein [Chloroflexi bacterium]|nr:helix-turn-helix domain-containing protein [Chloroflexota bacterium]
MTTKEWFTVEEAAEYLRVSRRTIYKLTTEGRLPAFRIGEERHRRFRKEDLDKVPMAGAAPTNRTGAETPGVESSSMAVPGDDGKTPEALPKPTAQPDPVLAEIWDDEKDATYDRI